jgi:hypothetical protein
MPRGAGQHRLEPRAVERAEPDGETRLAVPGLGADYRALALDGVLAGAEAVVAAAASRVCSVGGRRIQPPANSSMATGTSVSSSNIACNRAAGLPREKWRAFR